MSECPNLLLKEGLKPLKTIRQVEFRSPKSHSMLYLHASVKITIILNIFTEDPILVQYLKSQRSTFCLSLRYLDFL